MKKMKRSTVSSAHSISSKEPSQIMLCEYVSLSFFLSSILSFSHILSHILSVLFCFSVSQQCDKKKEGKKNRS